MPTPKSRIGETIRIGTTLYYCDDIYEDELHHKHYYLTNITTGREYVMLAYPNSKHPHLYRIG